MFVVLKTYRNYKLIVFLFLITWFTACAAKTKITVRPTSPQLEKIKNIAVIVPSENDFNVLFERTKQAKPMGGGGNDIITGLIFAYAEASAKNERVAHDEAIASRFKSKLKEFSCHKMLLNSLEKTLNNSGRFTKIYCSDHGVDQKKINEYDAIVTFYIQDWGVRWVEEANNAYLNIMSPFVEVETLMEEPSTKQMLWEEKDVVFSQARRSLATYETDDELFKKDLGKTIEDVGRFLAYTLIYY